MQSLGNQFLYLITGSLKCGSSHIQMMKPVILFRRKHDSEAFLSGFVDDMANWDVFFVSENKLITEAIFIDKNLSES